MRIVLAVLRAVDPAAFARRSRACVDAACDRRAAMKSNREDCKQIAALAEELVNGLLAETEGVEDEDLSERSRVNLADLEWRLQRTGKAMGEMRKATLVEHRRALQALSRSFS
ncbi:hypothetical protein LXA43DRAFT_449348 [Ganoderma leucocontextum]|nr:hypothetical protein LXA43DRAFT_449348 [Ganoderma leucocontextum]